MTQIRVGLPGDGEAIVAVHREAFGREEEAEIARRLHARGDSCVSLVAQDADEIVGQVFASPVSVDRRSFPRAPMGLGPIGVLPSFQRAGIGMKLCRAAIDVCRGRGTPFLVVLGHPTYYPRFGFVPATRFGLTFGDAPPRDAFMALELVPGALIGVTGSVRYGPEFG
jgi:putative acetyltransferase